MRNLRRAMNQVYRCSRALWISNGTTTECRNPLQSPLPSAIVREGFRLLEDEMLVLTEPSWAEAVTEPASTTPLTALFDGR